MPAMPDNYAHETHGYEDPAGLPRSSGSMRPFFPAGSGTGLIPDLRPGESVVILVRRHPVVLGLQLARPFTLLIVWLAGGWLAGSYVASAAYEAVRRGLPAWLPEAAWLAWMGVAAGLAAWAAYILLDWTDDWFALTTRRIIIMNKALFFRETRREAPVMKVQNVVAEYPSLLARSLDFGNLMIDTAGVGMLVFNGLPRPRMLREAIFARQTALRAKQLPPEDRRRATIRNILLDARPVGTPPTPDAGPARPPAPRSTVHEQAPDAHEQATPPYGQPAVAVGPQTRPRPRPQPRTTRTGSHTGLLGVLFPFEPRRDGATVVWHRHWYFLARGLLWPVVTYLAAVTGWVIVMTVTGPDTGLQSALGWAVVLLAPVCFLWAMWKWEDWRNELYKLDGERVYLVESLPFGLRERSMETLISRVTDVTYEMNGPLAHLLNFGDVVIKTPGEAVDFNFRGIPRPREAQQEIMARLDRYRLKESASVDEEIEAWLRAYHEITGGTQQGAGRQA
jgi:hypothetical protein